MTAHTPLPWLIFDDSNEHDISVDADDLGGCLTSQAVGPDGGEPVCMVVTKGFGPFADARHDANAAFIVRACNAHAELLNTLKKVRLAFVDRACLTEDEQNEHDDFWVSRYDPENGSTEESVKSDVMAEVLAAIAKAEGTANG